MDRHLDPLLRELMGAELRAERHRQRRTLAEVAAAAGLSMQHLSDVERGRKDPSSELLAAILGALGIDLPLLLLRAADGALVGAPVLELRSTPSAPTLAPGPAGLHGAGGRAGGSGVRLLAAA